MGNLYWYCDSCGNPEPAQPEYAHGDWEKCCMCEDGRALVVTVAEAAAHEQRKTLGLSVEEHTEYLTLQRERGNVEALRVVLSKRKEAR